MIFHLSGSIIAQSILGLSLNHFVDKVSGFYTPSPWNLSFLYLNLFRQNMVPNFFSRFSDIWTAPKHAFVSHDSNGKIVYSSSVILSAHDFRGHVSWCARSVLGILRPPNSSNTEIGDPDVPIIINDQVLGLNIPVYYLLLVAILESRH